MRRVLVREEVGENRGRDYASWERVAHNKWFSGDESESDYWV